jgi:hypothetical protein
MSVPGLSTLFYIWDKDEATGEVDALAEFFYFEDVGGFVGRV